MRKFRSIVEFEQSFERYCQILAHLPWSALRLQIIDYLFDEINRLLGASYQDSYHDELFPHLIRALSISPINLQYLDPEFLEKQTDRIWKYPVRPHFFPEEKKHSLFQNLSQQICLSYVRLQAWKPVLHYLSRRKFITEIPNTLESPENIKPHEFYERISPYLDPVYAELLARESEGQSFQSHIDKVAAMFVVKYEDFSAGIIGDVSFDSVRINRQAGQDKIRFANHIVDAHDIIADQARDLLTHFRTTHHLTNDQYLQISYSIDQPPSLVVGNSIGLAMALLGHIGLDTYRKNRPLQPMIYDDVAVTGALDSEGKLAGVNNEDIPAKISAAFFGPYKYVVLPKENEKTAQQTIHKLQQKYPNGELDVVTVSDVVELRQQRDIIHLQRRKILERARQLHKKYSSAFSYSLAGLFLFFVILGYALIVKNSTPAHAIPHEDRVVIKNKYGFKMWETASFGYQLRPQEIESKIKIKDLDGDGQREIVIGFDKDSPVPNRGDVICFNYSGEILWRYHPGETVHYGDNVYDDFFNVSQIFTYDFDSNGKDEIVAVGNQTFFPNYIVVLTDSGKMLSKFWHSGNLYDLAAFEVFPQNNVKELVIGGLNNEYARGIAIVLDPFRSVGASPQESHYYTNQEFSSGNEIYYLRFPSTHYLSKEHRDKVDHFMVNQQHRLLLKLYPSVYRKENDDFAGPVYYIFNQKMELNFVDLSDEYYHLYEKYYPDKPKLPYNDPDILNHFRQVEYWDGSNWTTTPTVNKHYLETLTNETQSDQLHVSTH